MEGADPDTAWGRTTGDGDMEANLLGAQPSAATLRKPGYGDCDQQPRVDGPQQGNQETEPESLRLIGGLIHRVGTLLLVGGVIVAQLVWVALLAYGAYWIGGRLPL